MGVVGASISCLKKVNIRKHRDTGDYRSRKESCANHLYNICNHA